jgi:hypothetical protein
MKLNIFANYEALKCVHSQYVVTKIDKGTRAYLLLDENGSNKKSCTVESVYRLHIIYDIKVDDKVGKIFVETCPLLI